MYVIRTRCLGRRPRLFVVCFTCFALISLSSDSWAATTYAIQITPTPNPWEGFEGSPGAINWTAKNTSSSDQQGIDLALIIDDVFVGSPSMEFKGGDQEDEAYNPRIENPAQYKGLVLLAGATFVFREDFDTRDLGNSVEPDFGKWLTSVVVTGQARGDSTLAGLAGAYATDDIFVKDPGATIPEPGCLALALSAWVQWHP